MKRTRRVKRRAPHRVRVGTHVIWPRALEHMLGLSKVTRWKWEREGRLPPRDVQIGKATGWRRETIERAITRT